MIKTVSGGLIDSNTYIVSNDKSKRAMIIDCGTDPSLSVAYVKENGLSVEYIVLTHGHFDHVDRIDKFISAFPQAKIVCHEDEIKVLLDPEGNLSTFISSSKSYNYPYITVANGDIITLKADDSAYNMDFKIIHSPGHTPGSICLLDEEKKLMITGDTLFKGSYGRIDFKYGSRMDMYASLRRLLSLDPEITFYPGHGEESKIKYEI
jgi:glyoxylase-like metal-dependent hydrolase (beta-lactamase superfamily II)